MKVFVTGLRGIPGVMGGVETHCEELLPRIAKSLPEIEIEVCCREPYVDPEMVSFRGVSLAPLYSPTSSASEAIVSTFLGILHARRRGADIVHIHAVGPALLAPLARLLGCKVLLTHHGADYNREKWGRFARWMLRAGEWVGMRFANQVICVSPSLAQDMQSAFPSAAKNVRFIPNGVSPIEAPETPESEVLAQFDLEPEKFILCAARLVPEKGVDYLIEAHARSGDPRTLVIAGAGRPNDKYADSLMAKACPRVRMLGMQPRTTLGVLYRNASLFVLPSFHEGLPIAALEALSCDCPVLLSDIQPNRDIGLPQAQYFPVGDTDALAARLRQGRQICQAAEAPGTSCEHSAVLMTWDEVAQRTAQSYLSLSARPQRLSELHHAN